MKHLLSLCLCASVFNLHAAVPLRWTVETSAANPATFDQFAGATYDLEATLQSRGKPLAVSGDPQLFWQTNGMGSAWWSAPASITNLSIGQSVNQTILKATWTPACDVGARVYNCFIGITGTVYNAAFQLRLRPSPGATPNELPLPVKVIDFSKVTVLNPPWPSGSARPLPQYLHERGFDDTYPDAADEYYRSRGDGKVDGGCSAVRDGGFLYRNFDFPFDERAEFIVKMSAGPDRFASVGVAQVGTNLTEALVTSGKPNRCYKWLPGATVDGINECGVVCEINVVDGEPQWRSGVLTASDIHPLAAVRWALDNGTSAGMVASNLAARIQFPPGWTQNFHWMIADAAETWIVENGTASNVTAVAAKRVMTNFPILPDTYSGMGKERYQLLHGGGPITNAWFTRAYSRSTLPPWESEFKDASEMEAAMSAWETHTREELRGKGLWQTVHCSIYDITNRTLRICVQETPDWYTFAVPSAGVKPEAVREIVTPMLASATNGLRRVDDMAVYTNAFSEFVWSSDDVNCPSGWIDIANSRSGHQPFFDYETGSWECSSIDGYVFEPTRDYHKDALVLVRVWFDDPITGDSFYVSATRALVQIPSDTLATSNGVDAAIASKRDLDDLTYVTTVPGGWQPTEVDGHRYDIYYDGYSGWYVEKLTYYPEWGEWYYEDSEFVYGPADAETLTAHKIWSDETITFTRQQIEVTDSLALVSQIGNQAEVAARNYIQNNDIAKTKTLLRTGKPGEYGTGWGTMHYQFSSDRRWWSMIVPTLTASWSTGGYVDTNGTYVAASTVHFPGSSYAYYRADPISQRDHTPIARFISSSGTNGSARCSLATWSVGFTAGAGTSSSSVKFDNSADLDAMPFLMTVDVDHAAGFVSARFEDRQFFPPMEFNLQDYHSDHYVLSNFRYGEATVTNGSVSVKCLYDVDVSYSTMRANFTAWCTLSLGCSAESYITTNPDYGRILTDTTRGMFWDNGLKATWRVNVTNGCFFAEVISTNNLSEGVN